MTGPAQVALMVNGEGRQVAVRPADLLLYTLREGLGLTGAKPGCENGDCGACTVLVDGVPTKSCMALTAEVVDRRVETVEGLHMAPAQKAVIEHWALQCGYCTSGFVMVVHGLATMHPDADGVRALEWLRSNICRCTGYEEIEAAARAVLAEARAARRPADVGPPHATARAQPS